jgi:hypothetical protein
MPRFEYRLSDFLGKYSGIVRESSSLALSNYQVLI